MTQRLRCGVLGDPIAHSLSPRLHRAAYAALGLTWEYDAHQVGTDQLGWFVGSLGPEWRGLSLTMPLKQVAASLGRTVDPLARRMNAVNTLVRDRDGWSGHNTDVGGCVDAVVESGLSRVTRGVVLGSGATAASALAAMVELGAEEVDVVARSLERAGRLVPLGRDLGVRVRLRHLDDLRTDESTPADLLVSTIPAAAQSAYVDALVGLATVVFDVVYEPRETPLLAEAARLGRGVVPGLELLLFQAARQVVLMTGVETAPVDAMRAALIR